MGYCGILITQLSYLLIIVTASGTLFSNMPSFSTLSRSLFRPGWKRHRSGVNRDVTVYTSENYSDEWMSLRSSNDIGAKPCSSLHEEEEKGKCNLEILNEPMRTSTTEDQGILFCWVQQDLLGHQFYLETNYQRIIYYEKLYNWNRWNRG